MQNGLAYLLTDKTITHWPQSFFIRYQILESRGVVCHFRWLSNNYVHHVQICTPLQMKYLIVKGTARLHGYVKRLCIFTPLDRLCKDPVIVNNHVNSVMMNCYCRWTKRWKVSTHGSSKTRSQLVTTHKSYNGSFWIFLPMWFISTLYARTSSTRNPDIDAYLRVVLVF